MKRLAGFCIIIVLCIILTGLCQTAIDPEEFTGQWFSAEDQRVYLFRDGLIVCSQNGVPVSEKEAISGAYSFSKKSIYLFAVGISGLETEKELYVVHKGEGSFLCENEDGSGKVYFIRYDE